MQFLREFRFKMEEVLFKKVKDRILFVKEEDGIKLVNLDLSDYIVLGENKNGK